MDFIAKDETNEEIPTPSFEGLGQEEKTTNTKKEHIATIRIKFSSKKLLADLMNNLIALIDDYGAEAIEEFKIEKYNAKL